MSLQQIVTIAAVLVGFCRVGTSATQTTAFPGVALRISQSGFLYVTQHVLPGILKELPSLISLPAHFSLNQSGIHFNFTNPKITKLTFLPPTIEPVTSPSGVKAVLTLNLAATSHFSYSGALISDHGIIDVTLSTVTVMLELGLEPASLPYGKWNFTLVDEKSSVGDIDMKFINVTHSIIDPVVAKLLKPVIKSQIAKTVTSMLPTAINVANFMIMKYLPVVNVGYGFQVDLSLVSKAIFKDKCYADIRMLGLVVYDGHHYGQIANFSFPEAKCDGPMFDVVISTGVLRSVLQALTMPSNKYSRSIPTGVSCHLPQLSIFFPQIAQHGFVGNMTAVVKMNNATSSFVNGRVTLGLVVDVSLLAKYNSTANKTVMVDLLLAVDVGGTVSMRDISPPINGSTQAVSITQLSISVNGVSVKSSNIGTVKVPLIQQILKAVLIQHIKDAQALAATGVLVPPVPRVGDIHLDIHTNQDYVRVLANIRAGHGKSGYSHPVHTANGAAGLTEFLVQELHEQLLQSVHSALAPSIAQTLQHPESVV